MNKNQINTILILFIFFIVYFLYFIGDVLNINNYQPDWLVVCIFFWNTLFFRKIQISIAWLLGLIFDILFGSIIGMHAFALSIVTYLIVIYHKIISNQHFITKIFYLSLITLIYKAIILWIEIIMLGRYFSFYMLITIFSNILISVVIYYIFLKIKHAYDI